ncbi:MAG: tRNA lysidine(34) synthetase TilS [Pseudomonadota bacterium]
MEEAARQARYAFLTEVRAEIGARYVVVGHTADDNAESVLLNLLRGAGPLGLSGIPPRRDWILRPLLSFRRGEILSYLGARGLAFVEDETNQDRRFLRNRVRRGLIPLLLEDFNPRLVEALNRTAALIRDEERVWTGLLAAAGREVGRRTEAGSVSFDAAALAAGERAVARRLIRAAVLEVQGTIRAWGLDAVEAVLDLAAEGRGRLDLPGRARAWVEGGRLYLGIPPARKPTGFSYVLPVPGRLKVPEAGLVITARRSDAVPEPAVLHQLGPDRAVLDAGSLRPPLTVRSVRPGDRFQPLGFSGTRKLSDFFIDKKIPAPRRPFVPLVCDGDGVVWVGGFRSAERTRVGPGATSVVMLTLSEEAGGGSAPGEYYSGNTPKKVED